MTGAALEKYTHFDASHDSTHNLVVGLVPPGARVLEFGCASGYMSAELRQRLGCHVTGIERDPAAAELAHGHAERVIAGDAETLDYVDLFEGERFDVLLFADVLEHLLDPAGLLRRVRPLLAEGGIVVASIPNVAHGSVRVALLGGEFRYTAKGLLDDTHLRFFTRDSVAELFESAGFVIDEWQRKSAPIDQTEVAVPELAALDLVRAQLDADPEATTYQFVVRARRLEDTDAPRPPRAELELLRAEVEGREAALRRLEAKLDEANATAARQARELAEREAAIDELREGVRNRDQLHSELRQLQQAVADVRDELVRRAEHVQSSVYELSARVAANDDTARDYLRVIRRVQEAVRMHVPRNATVLVASRGDDALLDLYGRTGWHFPRTDEGTWAGTYPACNTSAIAQLETLRALGAEFVLFPKPAEWWLSHYSGLKRHLDQHYAMLLRRDDTGVLYDLRHNASGTAKRRALDSVVAAARRQLGREPAILDWGTQLNLAVTFPLLSIFSPPTRSASLPYLDASVDIVAIAADDPLVHAEAQRVAALAVLNVSDSDIQVCWTSGLPATVSNTPSISIIVPCFNNVAYTLACLRAVRETLPPDIDTQVVVIDDASTDATRDVLAQLAQEDPRLTVVTNPVNLGFIGSCNRGVEHATGDLLVFLNNDTLPIAGWLEAIVHTFNDYPDAGVVGAKLLFADGRLQEAGGLVFSDGSAANVGRGEHDAEAPLFEFVRRVDYCSGAMLATPRELFERLGGFDVRYAPAYYEDTDYCFAVRGQGRAVYYQPRAAIVHREGASSGTDLHTGVKRFQVVNHAKFASKWADVLVGQPQRPSRFDRGAWYALVHAEAGGA